MAYGFLINHAINFQSNYFGSTTKFHRGSDKLSDHRNLQVGNLLETFFTLNCNGFSMKFPESLYENLFSIVGKCNLVQIDFTNANEVIGIC